MAKLYNKTKQNDYKVHFDDQTDLLKQIYKPKKLESNRISSIMARRLGEFNYDEKSRSFRMFHCGDYITLDTPYKKSSGEVFYNQTKVIQANFCKDRFCPMCQYRLSRKTGINLAKCMKVLHDCNFSFLFLTLTIPNVKGDDLHDAIDGLYKGWSRFYHLKDVQCAFKGYFKALEVTYNLDDDTYHPHLHILVVVNKSYFTSRYYLSVDDITSKWVSCVNNAIQKIGNENIIKLIRDDFYEVHIKKVKDTTEDFKSSCLELSKYISKSNDITEITFDTFFRSLSGVRSFEYIGDFKVVYKTLGLNNDVLDEDQEDCNADIGHIINYFTFDYDDMIYALKRGDK